MKTKILAAIALFIGLSVPAFSIDYTDPNVPGLLTHKVSGAYQDNITINTTEQRSIYTYGSYQCSGGNTGCTAIKTTMTSATLAVMNPDGTTSQARDVNGNPVVMLDHPARLPAYNVYIDHWVASGEVPPGVYVLSVSGEESCSWRGVLCNYYTSAPYYVTVE